MPKLDTKDNKILQLLDENCRYSDTQIAKKVKLSKPALEYRIKKLIKNKAIFKFYTVIDFGKLGYQQYKIYFKFQNITIKDEKEIIKYWTDSENSAWVAEVRSKWDITVSILAESNYKFGRIVSEFMNQFSHFVLDKNVVLTEYSPIYSKATLSLNREFIYGTDSVKHTIDKTDVKILSNIANNARMSIVEIVKKTKLTRDIVNYRIKKLKEKGIIVQFRCYPNLENVGIKLYKLILRTKNLNEREEKRLREYVKIHKKATQLLKVIGGWDIEIEFEVKNEDELYTILLDIRKDFSEVIRDYDILRITKSHKLNFFPFSRIS